MFRLSAIPLLHRADHHVMQGHFTVLPSKYHMYCILLCIIIASILLKSQIIILSYNINQIIVKEELF